MQYYDLIAIHMAVAVLSFGLAVSYEIKHEGYVWKSELMGFVILSLFPYVNMAFLLVAIGRWIYGLFTISTIFEDSKIYFRKN